MSGRVLEGIRPATRATSPREAPDDEGEGNLELA